MHASRRGSLLFWGGSLLALILLAAAAAPLLAPRDPAAQPDPASGRYLAPGSRRSEVRLRDGGLLLAERVERVPGGLRVDRLGETRTLADHEVVDLDADGMPRERLFLLGSDGLGRDVLSRLLYAARVSLTIGLLAAALAMTLGAAVGGLAGLAGGRIDALLMRLVDALLAFPRLFLVIALAAFWPSTEGIVVLVLGLTGWMGAARLVRAEVLSLKQREFVLAARAVGQSPARVLVRHLLPNALTPVLVDTALRVGDIILIEAALSFIGLGVQPPAASWGNMVADGAPVLDTAWWVSTFPGLAIAATVVAFGLLADGLRDRLDPRSA